MTVQTKTFIELAQEAFDGKYKLPAFQREWKWKRKQVQQLFDSLRRKYPIGGFLLVHADLDFNLEPRPFEFAASTATKKKATRKRTLYRDSSKLEFSGLGIVA
jgi:hypothetical protein